MIKRKENLIERGWSNKLTVYTFKRYSRTCYLFLQFLFEVNVSVSEISNNLIDDFLRNFYVSIVPFRCFLRWINKNVTLFQVLKLPKYYLKEKGDCYSEDEFFQIIENLSKTSIPYKHKVICFLSIFYAVRPFELRQLKLSDYIKTEINSKLFIRGTWVCINSFVTNIINCYIKNERTSKYSLGSDIEWLFFGVRYNTPLTAFTIYKILNMYDIFSTKAFATVLTHSYIYYGLQPSVLISGLGININTAIAYYKSLNIENMSSISNIPACIGSDFYAENFYVYILQCSDGSYYTGYTSNLSKRLTAHQNGYGCTYTKKRVPVELVYNEDFPDKKSAMKREKQIKKLSIYDKVRLIEKSRAD